MATTPHPAIPLAREIERDCSLAQLAVQVEARKVIDAALDTVGYYRFDGIPRRGQGIHLEPIHITLDRILPILHRYSRAGWYCAWAYILPGHEQSGREVGTAEVYFWIRKAPIVGANAGLGELVVKLHHLPDPPAHTVVVTTQAEEA